MTVYVLRIADAGKCWWTLSDGTHLLRGQPGESRANLYERWRQQFGPIAKLIRYRGVHRLSEAAMTLASLRLDKETE